MNKLTIGLLLGAFLFMSSGVNASSGIFAYTMCGMDSKPFEKNVKAFVNKLIKVRRVKARHSQYRKHIERHAKEMLEAFNAAQGYATCSRLRKEKIQQMQMEYQGVLSGRAATAF